ncbi:MAG: hypothetical protein EBR02_05760 [Alphaproteobacteria bacterium]|nr:hypothetical protein [Alphaproteobacteria bacterium]
MRHPARKIGFTLLELALVLMVIGLLVGAIIAGKSMIRSSKLQSVIVEQQRYIKAINDFRDKYQALPGDFSGASGLWASTADGNGDGIITAWSNPPTGSENYLVWKHLTKAGFIDGSYTGVAASPATTTNLNAGENIPESKLGDGTSWLMFLNNPGVAAHANSFTTNPRNHIIFLSADLAAAISNSEGKMIDDKIDDGLSTTGKVGAGEAGAWAATDTISRTLFINTDF